jgi:hypothetical protein
LGPIPAGSVLRFEVELVDFEGSKLNEENTNITVN